MSDDLRRLETEEQVERFYRARRRGGACAACGRKLEGDEPVYVEPFEDVRRQRGGFWAQAAVGSECASGELLHDAATRGPEHCAGCERPMYYGRADARRRRALCSQNCRSRADRRRQAGG